MPFTDELVPTGASYGATGGPGGFGVEIAAFLGLLDHNVAIADARQIFVGATQRRVIGSNAFEGMTGFQQIEL